QQKILPALYFERNIVAATLEKEWHCGPPLSGKFRGLLRNSLTNRTGNYFRGTGNFSPGTGILLVKNRNRRWMRFSVHTMAEQNTHPYFQPQAASVGWQSIPPWAAL